jgi:two-component system KDP operon response regulator KdpE
MNSSEKASRIVIADDEEAIRQVLGNILGREYDVALASCGQEAIDLVMDRTPDLIVLDLAMPGMDGLEVCQRLRTWISTPILVLSVRSGDDDKISALDLGADDYLTKPFSTGELLARIRALLRRPWALPSSEPTLRADGLEIDFALRTVHRDGEEIKLTRTQFDLLACLARNANRVVPARMIAQAVWGPQHTDEGQVLRVHIAHLRRKIESHPSVPRYILTEPGIGYRFRLS